MSYIWLHRLNYSAAQRLKHLCSSLTAKLLSGSFLSSLCSCICSIGHHLALTESNTFVLVTLSVTYCMMRDKSFERHAVTYINVLLGHSVFMQCFNMKSTLCHCLLRYWQCCHWFIYLCVCYISYKNHCSILLKIKSINCLIAFLFATVSTVGVFFF
jgi:hypothetical protein